MVVYLLNLVVQILTILVILHVVFSYFLSPYHPLREAIDRVVNPILAPIRRYVAPVGGLDFSPIILILLMQVIGSVLANVLGRF